MSLFAAVVVDVLCLAQNINLVGMSSRVFGLFYGTRIYADLTDFRGFFLTALKANGTRIT
ncbi:MAG: hypothetical protein FWG87_11690 [Defluviitaleaceae bacterium]|nr:hypothetical protein [Defluviitaleaceae bacterium]